MQPAPALATDRAIVVGVGLAMNIRKPNRIRTESNQHLALSDELAPELFVRTGNLSSDLRVNDRDD
jgi:hypothetical protein